MKENDNLLSARILDGSLDRAAEGAMQMNARGLYEEYKTRFALPASGGGNPGPGGAAGGMPAAADLKAALALALGAEPFFQEET